MDSPCASLTVSTGWPAVDTALKSAGCGDGQAGLARGAVHEWFGVGSPIQRPHSEGWSPPLFLLTHLTKRAVLDAQSRGAPDQVVWIGRNVWPYPRTLSDSAHVVQVGKAPAQHQLRLSISLVEPEAELIDGAKHPAGPDLLHRSLFVATGARSRSRTSEGAKEASERLWAIDTALRCRGVTAVVADGTGLTMAATRRLQLSAASTGVLVLLARPPQEAGEISAATTRWTVMREVPTETSGSALSWDLTLLRAKGAQRLSLETEHRPKKITAALLEALAASAGGGGEDMGRRRNQPSIHRYVHSHAARLSTPSTFVFYSPIPAPPPASDAPTWSPEDLLSALDQNERRARLDRRPLQ